jgi:exonuclease SbcC
VRPLSLEITGFTAFRDRQRVSFEGLGLFVITGPTGAGKTSLLDAMVFSLYGQVPRLGGSQGTRDLVSLGQVEARVAFEFAVRGKGRYRVARRLPRKGAQMVTLERLEGEDWVSEVDHGGVRVIDPVIADLVGLDFDSFCRAVVLPQGEFHRFLKGDAADRRRVLFSLLGVNYFLKMAEVARGRATVLAAAVERTEDIIVGQYADATEAAVSVAESEHANAARAAGHVAEVLVLASEQMAIVETEERRVQTLASQAQELGEQVPALQTLAEDSRTAETVAAGVAEEVAAAAQRVVVSRGAVETADMAVAERESEYGGIEVLVAASSAAVQLAGADDELLSGETAAEQARTTSLAARQTAAAAEAERVALDEQVSGDQKRYEQVASLLETIRQREDRSREAAAAAEKLSTELTTARDAVTVATRAAEEAEAQARSTGAALIAARDQLEALRRTAAVAELAMTLAVGDDCPVCGVALTSRPHVEHEVAQRLIQSQDRESVARGAADRAREAATRAAGRVEEEARGLTRLEERFREALGEAPDLIALLSAQTHRAAELAHRQEEVRLEGERLTKLRRRCAAALQGARDAGVQAARCDAAADAAKTSVDSIQRRRQQSRVVLAEHFGGDVPADAAGLIAGQRAALESAQSHARDRRDELESARVNEAEARDRAECERERLASVASRLSGLRARAEGVRRDLTVVDLAAPAVPLDGTDRQEAIEAALRWAESLAEAVDQAFREAAARSVAAQAQISGLARAVGLDEENPSAAMAALSKADRDAATRAAQTQMAVQHAKERVLKRQELEHQISEERDHVNVLNDLALELRQNRFGEYIVHENLTVLAARASEELMRISDNRYSLVTGSGDFDVVDHANADEQRSVKTLSGGETFLASLALALALSRHIGELASEGLGAKLEAVFIDEGFGTLDPATLEDVIDALERLRDDDLVVGVISHVPELAERIRSGLEVRKDDGRSQIIMNLEGA